MVQAVGAECPNRCFPEAPWLNGFEAALLTSIAFSRRRNPQGRDPHWLSLENVIDEGVSGQDRRCRVNPCWSPFGGENVFAPEETNPSVMHRGVREIQPSLRHHRVVPEVGPRPPSPKREAVDHRAGAVVASQPPPGP